MSNPGPLFIISSPRSGSTLLQRLLTAHSDIASADEPWLALPLVFALREFGHFSEYSGASANAGLKRVISKLPEGVDDYWAGCRKMMMNIYCRLNTMNSAIFIDKTPRYYLILSELRKIFPAAKFIILHRNPLAVISSTLTHNDGNIRGLYLSEQDIVRAPQLISCFMELEAKTGLVYQVSYEKLVTESEVTLRGIMSFIGLDFQPSQIHNFSEVHFESGDRVGADLTEISLNSLSKWKSGLSTYTRKHLAKKLLLKIPADSLLAQGYDKYVLLAELHRIKSGGAVRSGLEAVELLAALAYKRCNASVFRRASPMYHIS